MKWLAQATFIGSLACMGFNAGSAIAEPPPEAINLRGLTSAEADVLLATIRAAQVRLRQGDHLYFELLSGAPASYAATQITPRDAFLALPFAKPFSVEARPADTPAWRPYRIELPAEKRGGLVWQIDVVVGLNGQLERVEMLNRPAHPY